MDQFDAARLRSAKMEVKRERYQPLTAETAALREIPQFKDVQSIKGTLHLPKIKPPKAPMKRTNEIGVTIYLDGEIIQMTVRVNLNDIIASQRTRHGLAVLLKEALAVKFGKVDIT